MDIDLSRYNEEELIELNRRIVERIRLLRQGRCRETMTKFHIGDRVSFHPDCGHAVVGTIVRLNKKSVTVVSSDGVHWRVAPVFLKTASTKADDDPPANDDAKLIGKVEGDLIEFAERLQERDRGKA